MLDWVSILLLVLSKQSNYKEKQKYLIIILN